MDVPALLHLLQDLTGKTQTELASDLGVTFAALNRWINGKAVPRPRARARLERLLADYVGSATLPADPLAGKKRALLARAKRGPPVLRFILARPDILDEFVLRLTYTSNRIEGSTLTEAETAAVIFDDAAVPRRALADQIAAKNHQAALHALFDYLSTRKSMTEEFLLRLHGILMNGLRDDAGRYRLHGVRIVGSNIPTANYLSVPRLMANLVKALSPAGQDVIRHAADIHAQFEKIHPFSDGNGRVGRLLLHAMLLRANLLPTIIRPERKRRYYAALNEAQRGGSTVGLEEVICDGMLEAQRSIGTK
jgi:Fic family protein